MAKMFPPMGGGMDKMLGGESLGEESPMMPEEGKVAPKKSAKPFGKKVVKKSMRGMGKKTSRY